MLVVCASTALTANTSRDVYLQANAEIVDGIAERLTGWHGVVVMVTNPVDPLTARLARALGDRRRVVGYTLNDSLRLRTSIAGSLGVPARAVEAWVLGEHGDRAVPVFSRVRVDGEPVTLTASQRAEAADFVRNWYRRHVALDSGRSSTWTSGAGRGGAGGRDRHREPAIHGWRQPCLTASTKSSTRQWACRCGSGRAGSSGCSSGSLRRRSSKRCATRRAECPSGTRCAPASRARRPRTGAGAPRAGCRGAGAGSPPRPRAARSWRSAAAAAPRGSSR